MDLGLTGKVALVTAASRGLGRAIAEELADEGCRVAICARGEADLEQTAASLRDAGATVLARTCDVSKLESLRALVDETAAELGPVDVLVTNAGGPPAGTFEQHDADTWARAFELTLRSAVELTRLVLPAMRERRWGRVLNVTSIAVKQPVDGLMLSNSLRAAVTGFARTLANEVATDGVTVNNLLPGFTRTSRVEQLAQSTAEREQVDIDAVYDRWRGQIPMGRIGEPREFAALAAFLASDRASYITGQSVAVDGGWIRSLV